MPEDMTGGMTVISKRAFENAAALDLSAGNAAQILATIPARSFSDILMRFAPEEAGREKLVDGLCGNDPSRSRASMDKKVRGWLSGKYQPTAREDLLELCFILKLSVEEADAFLAATSEEGMHWRDPKELTYAFALRKGMTYPEATALLTRVIPKENVKTKETREAFTSVVQREAAGLETEGELKQYLLDAGEKLGTFHNRAYQQFMEFLSLLEQPHAVSVDKEDNFTVRRIVETYLDNRFPSDWDKKKLDDKRRGILAGWPDEVALSRMKTGKIDVNRKTLILLFLATDGGEEITDDWQEDVYWDEDEEGSDADADFCSSYREAWITASAQVTEKGAKILEDMEKALDEISTAFGMNAYSIQRYNQDSEAMEADFQWIAGMPPAIPLPDFWYSSENRSLHPNSGDTGGEGLPDTLIWRIPDISVEQFLTYVHQLSEIGFEGELTGAAQEGWKNTLTVNGNICIIMYRTDSTVMIAYHPNQLTLEAR